MTVRLRSVPVPFDPETILAQSQRFTPLSELGRGASAVVYEVEDRLRGERVALKLHYRRDARTRGALDGEADIARAVQHPNLVRVHEVGELAGRPYLLMELVEGVSLGRYARGPDGRLDLDRVRAGLVQLVSAVDALHGVQRVHRDVKPSNVRVASDGRLVLLDLGIAAERGDLVWAEPGIGTPSYMAPEQVAGGFVGPAADLYAVGALLYELLTGALPHPAAAHGETQVKLSTDPVRPRALRPEVPAELDALCMALLARDPELRPEARLVLKKLGHPGVDLGHRVLLHAPGSVVGREGLFARVDRARESAHVRGHWLAIDGPPGRGKRAFVRACLARSGGRALTTRFQRHPRGAFDGLDAIMLGLCDVANRRGPLEHLPTSGYASWLGQMFPAFRFARCLADVPAERATTPDPVVRRRRALSLLRDVVLTLAAEEPLTVFLDRLDLAPPDVLSVLTHAFAGVPGLLLISTGRAPLAALAESAERLSLPPLEDSALGRIVEEQWQRSTGEHAPQPGALARQADGEPWAALELARAALRGHRQEDPVAALRTRLAALPDEARQLLCLLAVAERELPQHLWLEVSGLDERTFHRHLFALLEAALIERVSDWVAPAFALTHGPQSELLLAELAPGARAELHRDLSIASPRHGELSDEERTAHLEAAGLDLEAARSYELLANEAEARLGFAYAAELRTRALRLAPPRERQGEVRLRRLGHALLLAGLPGRAAEAFSSALTLAAPAEEFELRHLRAEALLRAGSIQAGMAAAQEALSQLGLASHPSEPRAALDLVWQRTLLAVRGTRFRPRPRGSFSPYELSRIDALLGVSLRLGTIDAVRGAELQARALRFALREREPLRVARGLAHHVSQCSVDEPEPHARSFALLEGARELVRGHRDPALGALLDVVEAGVQLFDMHPDRALTLCLLAERTLLDECTDVHAELWLARLYAVAALALCGDMHALTRHCAAWLDEARELGDQLLENLVELRGLSHLALWRDGSPGAADAHIERAMASWPAGPATLQHYFAVLTRSLVSEHRREPGLVAAHDARCAQLAHALFMRARSPRLSLDGARATLLGVEASLAQGDARTERTRDLTRAVTRLARDGGAMARFHALCHTPMERQLAGDLEGARRALVALAQYAHERGLKLHAAQAKLAMARLEHGDARARLETEAHASFAELGVQRPERLVGLLLPGLA